MENTNTRGGARQGAGRHKVGREYLNVRVKTELLAKLDSLRKDQSRSEYIEELLERLP